MTCPERIHLHRESPFIPYPKQHRSGSRTLKSLYIVSPTTSLQIRHRDYLLAKPHVTRPVICKTWLCASSPKKRRVLRAGGVLGFHLLLAGCVHTRCLPRQLFVKFDSKSLIDSRQVLHTCDEVILFKRMKEYT